MSTILKKSHWNWINIAMYVIEIIVVISVIKFLMQLFGGTSGVGAGVASVFGAGANFINGISDGCSKQQDCSEGKASLKDCKAIMNCSFRQITVPVVPGTGPGPGTKLVTTCVSTNGTPAGGGISTLGCLFGIGAIIAAFTAVISAIGLPFTLLGEDSMTESAKNLAKMLGGKIPRNLIEKSYKFADSIIQGLQTLNSGDAKYLESLESNQTVIGEIVARTEVTNSLLVNGASVKIVAESVEGTVIAINGVKTNNPVLGEDVEGTIDADTEGGAGAAMTGMIRKALVPDNDFVINDVFKTYLKKHINRLGLSLNTTEQAVLEGKYNDQSVIKDNIDRVITTVFSAN